MVGPGFRTEEPLSFKTLLLCLDGSQQSEAMLPHAAAWAEGLKMSIRILHVAPPPPPPDAEIPPGREYDDEERQHEARQRIEAYLEKVTARLSFGSVQATWEVIESDSPGHTICQVAGSLPGAVIGESCNVCDGVFIENDVVVTVGRTGGGNQEGAKGESHVARSLCSDGAKVRPLLSRGFRFTRPLDD